MTSTSTLYITITQTYRPPTTTTTTSAWLSGSDLAAFLSNMLQSAGATAMAGICAIPQNCQTAPPSGSGQQPLTCSATDLACVCGQRQFMTSNGYFDVQCVFNQCTDAGQRRAFMSNYINSCASIGKQLFGIPEYWRPFAPPDTPSGSLTISGTPTPVTTIPSSFSITITPTAAASNNNSTPSPTSTHLLAPADFSQLSHAHLSAGAIAGIVLGTLLILAVLFSLAWISFRARRKARRLAKSNAILTDQMSNEGATAHINSLLNDRDEAEQMLSQADDNLHQQQQSSSSSWRSRVMSGGATSTNRGSLISLREMIRRGEWSEYVKEGGLRRDRLVPLKERERVAGEQVDGPVVRPIAELVGSRVGGEAGGGSVGNGRASDTGRMGDLTVRTVEVRPFERYYGHDDVLREASPGVRPGGKKKCRRHTMTPHMTWRDCDCDECTGMGRNMI